MNNFISMQRLALRNTILIKKGERSFSAKHRNNSPPPPHFPQKKAINKSNDNRIRNETPNIRTLEISIFSCSSRSFFNIFDATNSIYQEHKYRCIPQNSLKSKTTLEYLLFGSWVALFRSNILCKNNAAKNLELKNQTVWVRNECVNYLKDNFTTFCIVD